MIENSGNTPENKLDTILRIESSIYEKVYINAQNTGRSNLYLLPDSDFGVIIRSIVEVIAEELERIK